MNYMRTFDAKDGVTSVMYLEVVWWQAFVSFYYRFSQY
jgi:hypothetical protein